LSLSLFFTLWSESKKKKHVNYTGKIKTGHINLLFVIAATKSIMKKIMVIFRYFLCIYLIFLSLSSQGGEVESKFNFKTHTFKNGMKLWCWPKLESESVLALLAVRVGSRNETEENNGISHFLEHMVFTGTEKWTDLEVTDFVEKRGGRWNGYTRRERTYFYIHLAHRELDFALDWLSQIVFHATLPEDKFKKEKNVVFQERFGRWGWLINWLDSIGLGYELELNVKRTLYPGSTIGLRVVGEDHSLDAIDGKILREYYEKYYIPNNANLIVVGNFDYKLLLEKITNVFGDIKRGKEVPRFEKVKEPALGPYNVLTKGPFPTDEVRLIKGFITIDKSHLDNFALNIVAQILNRNLKNEIRYQRGLVYGLWAGNYGFNDWGEFSIQTYTDSENHSLVLSLIDEQLEKCIDGGFEEKIVEEAKQTLLGRWALRMESHYSLAHEMADWDEFDKGLDYISNYSKYTDAVTIDDLKRVMGKYFVPQRSYLAQHIPIVTVFGVAVIFGIGILLAALVIIYIRRLRRKLKKV
jgi:predicted Zn-dependent peptidase